MIDIIHKDKLIMNSIARTGKCIKCGRVINNKCIVYEIYDSNKKYRVCSRCEARHKFYCDIYSDKTNERGMPVNG